MHCLYDTAELKKQKFTDKPIGLQHFGQILISLDSASNIARVYLLCVTFFLFLLYLQLLVTNKNSHKKRVRTMFTLHDRRDCSRLDSNYRHWQLSLFSLADGTVYSCCGAFLSLMDELNVTACWCLCAVGNRVAVVVSKPQSTWQTMRMYIVLFQWRT